MIEAGGTEVVLNVRWQAFVLAEHDPEHDPAADSVRPACDGALDPLAKAIAEPGEPAATTEIAPARRVEDDVDSLTREPVPLVEAVVFGPRLDDPHCGLEDRASRRRRAADREDEQHALADRHVSEGPGDRDNACRPGRRAGGRDRHELGGARLADAAGEHALAQSLHAQRSPGEPDDGDDDGKRGDSRGGGELEQGPHGREHDDGRRR